MSTSKREPLGPKSDKYLEIGRKRPILGGYLFDVTGSYHLAFLLCVISSAIVSFFSLLTKQPKNHKGLTR